MDNAVRGDINLIPIRAGLGQLQTIGGHVYSAQSGVNNVNIHRINDGASIEEFPRKQAMD